MLLCFKFYVWKKNIEAKENNKLEIKKENIRLEKKGNNLFNEIIVCLVVSE